MQRNLAFLSVSCVCSDRDVHALFEVRPMWVGGVRVVLLFRAGEAEM